MFVIITGREGRNKCIQNSSSLYYFECNLGSKNRFRTVSLCFAYFIRKPLNELCVGDELTKTIFCCNYLFVTGLNWMNGWLTVCLSVWGNFGCNLISTVPAIKKFLWANLLCHQASFFTFILVRTDIPQPTPYALFTLQKRGTLWIGLMMGWLLMIATTKFGTDFRDSWLIGDYVICLKQWLWLERRRRLRKDFSFLELLSILYGNIWREKNFFRLLINSCNFLVSQWNSDL